MCHILLRWTRTSAYSDNKPRTCGVFSPATQTHESYLIKRVVYIGNNELSYCRRELNSHAWWRAQPGGHCPPDISPALLRRNWQRQKMDVIGQPLFGPSSSIRTPMLSLLSVPIEDLVDVPEDDFLFSFHVLGDALILDILHETLGGQKRSVNDDEQHTELLVEVTWH